MSSLPSPITLGRARITRIPEMVVDMMAPNAFFPDLDAEVLSPDDWRLMTGQAEPPAMLSIPVHSWLVELDGLTVLIDTGAGNGKTRDYSKVFTNLNNPFLERLAEAGVTPDDVDLVLMTHLHTDHVGWNTRLDGDRWVPTFPKARYVFAKAEQEFFETTAPANRRVIYEDSVLPVIEAGLAETIPAEGAVINGLFTFIPTPGHTAGHMAISLTSEGKQALFTGDVMHSPIQVGRPALSCVFCIDKAQAETTRRSVLNEAADTGATLFTAHFPGNSMGHIRRSDSGFSWQPL
jgi:glyoxylase-like metal-dependent hydrolase (beta-lactamase superfamily II)